MRAARTDVLSPDLAEAKARFDRWRLERRAQTRIPLELWNTALALVPAHGVARVSTLLRLSFSELKRRSLAGQLRPIQPPSEPPAFSFVALPPTLPLEPVRREACLELSHPSGTTLRLTLSEATLDLPALLSAFLRGAP